ncbi:hypothetical protein D3C71_1487320 [compost metagenome]
MLQLVLGACQRRPGLLAKSGIAPVGDKRLQPLQPLINTDIRRLVKPVQNRSISGVILRMLRHKDQILDRRPRRIIVPPIPPSLWNPLPPAFLQKRQVSIRPPQKQHMMPERIAAGKNGKVLRDDRIRQRTHDFR